MSGGVGGGVSTNQIELSRLEINTFIPPIDPLTHPTTHTPTHGWGCRIELSRSTVYSIVSLT